MYACSTGVEEEGEDGTKGPDGCCMCICINIMSMWRSCGKLYIVRIAVVVYNRVAKPCDDGTCRVSHVFSHRLKSISTACIRTYKTMNLCFSHFLLTSISI